MTATHRPRLKPFPSKPTDWEYLARNRRAAWLGLFASAGRLLAPPNEEAFQKAMTDIRNFHERLAALGVASEDAP